MDDFLVNAKVGDQFFAVYQRKEHASRTPYEVVSVKRQPGAADHVWMVITARRLQEAPRVLDTPHIPVSVHGAKITLRRLSK